jgi:hypothetical protein
MRVLAGVLPTAFVLAAWVAGAPAVVASACSPSDANSVLILASSNGLEAQEARSLGYTTNVLGDWSTCTPSDFAAYRAIVVGDPICALDTSYSNGAINTRAVWGPAVTGNAIIIGTDPSYHLTSGLNQSGAKDVIDRGLLFAASGSGTGAYLSLSCSQQASFTSPGQTPLLGYWGDFRSYHANCTDSGHVVSIGVGITNADLVFWNCSVHEAFASYPAVSNGNRSWTVVAINQRTGPGAIQASDGTFGDPYILASGRVGACTSNCGTAANLPSLIRLPFTQESGMWKVLHGFGTGEHVGGMQYAIDLDLSNGQSPGGQPILAPVSGVIRVE